MLRSVGTHTDAARSSPAWRLLRGALVVSTIAAIAVALVFIVLGESTSDITHTLLSIFFLGVPGTYTVVGALVCRRRPENTVGWLCLAIGFVWAVQAAAEAVGAWTYARGLPSIAEWMALSDPLWLPAVGLTSLLVLTFPDGQLLSARWRWFAWFCTGSFVLVTIQLVTVPGRVTGLPGTENPIGSAWLQHLSPLFVLIPISFVGAVTSLVLRYRRSDGLARLQIRWIAFAGMVLLAVGLPLLVATLLGSLTAATGFPVPVALIDTAANMTVPLTIGVAVLRYRLYEIDTIINRTLVYAGLTAVLVATYLVSVLAFRFVLDPITGKSDLAVAVSTLGVAALFRPLRSRIQRLVDRRFYRRKYDAARTLESFVARLREEVDLEAVGLDLRAVVNETMQPAHVSLWLQRGP